MRESGEWSAVPGISIPTSSPATGERSFASTSTCSALSVNDVPSAVDEVLEHGGLLLGQIATTTVAGVGELQLIYLRDPEGKIIELQAWQKTDD
jgi:hypothetical protein